ncbi:MAG: glycosyltransferase [Chitinivibrionales bacterium]|nr:glycosyltransferase [Chitinivibrionales bacterium]MBD3358846.1 glycosyltransferase [Chitinivibrionales bacterium]
MQKFFGYPNGEKAGILLPRGDGAQNRTFNRRGEEYMRIGVTAEFVGTNAGGPETYCTNLIKRLGQCDTGNEYHIYVNQKSARKQFSNLSENVVPHHLFGGSRWIVVPIAQPLAAALHGLDLFHATFAAPPLLPIRSVVTVCELGFEKHDDFYPPLMTYRLRRLHRRGTRRAERVLSISEYTKQDLIECYGLDPAVIDVIHWGVSERFKPAASREETAQTIDRYKIREPYILYVGKFEKRKNIPRLLKAYHLMKMESKHPHSLVLVGKRSYLFDDIDPTIEKLNMRRDVKILENICRDDVVDLFKGASLFVFPSLLESFGIPPIEAMACGVPVVASSATAIPEIAGDAAYYCNPTNITDIAAAMNAVLEDNNVRTDLVAKGFKRAALFSWRNTVERTVEAYKKVLR